MGKPECLLWPLSGNEVLLRPVRYDAHSGHRWGTFLPTLIMSAIASLADIQAGGDLSPFGQERT